MILTGALVDRFNDETINGDYEKVITKYGLKTPDDYFHESFTGDLKVYGVTEDGELLVWDDGWWLIVIEEWLMGIEKKIRNPRDIEEVFTKVPAVRDYVEWKRKKTTIQVTAGTLADLRRKKLVESETWESVIQRLIKDSDKRDTEVRELSEEENEELITILDEMERKKKK